MTLDLEAIEQRARAATRCGCDENSPSAACQADGVWHARSDVPALVSEVRRLREALKRLANEAHGFLSMADRDAHGVTNVNVLRLRIDEARAALKGDSRGS